MRIATTLIAHLLLLVANACTRPTSVTLQSQAHTLAQAPVTRLLLFARVQRGRFHHMYPGFKLAMIKGLKSCSVESILVDAEHRQDLEQVFDRWVARFRPDAVMSLDLEPTSTSRVPNVLEIMWFNLKIHDVLLGKTIWRAQVRLSLGKGPSYDPSETGMRFSARIIEQMQSDGILRYCPADEHR
jgi:hypothetical protein